MDKDAERERYWQGHVGAWRASGDTQRAYCDRHGLKNHSLSYWHLRLARGTNAQEGSASLTLIPAVRVPEEAASLPSLSLTIANGWRLEFAGLPPAVWLAELCERRS